MKMYFLISGNDSTLYPNNLITYDTIRLHLISGFNFSGNNGFTLNIKCLDGYNDIINLLNLAITKSDSIERLNHNPFYFSDKYYTFYIEFKILSLYSLIHSYHSTTGDPQFVKLISKDNTITNKLLDGGIKRNQNIQFQFNWITEIEKTSTSEICTIGPGVEFDIELIDSYSDISARIELSEDGQYFKYQGLYKGKNIGDFFK